MTPDQSLAHAVAAGRDFDAQEEAARAMMEKYELDLFRDMDFAPIYDVHYLMPGHYLLERQDQESWTLAIEELEQKRDILRVNIVSTRITHVRICAPLSPGRLRDLVDSIYLPF